MPKKKTEEKFDEYETGVVHGIEALEAFQAIKSEKELLIECYEFMKSRGINSISDVENKISRL